ncbi:hypothetical protein PIB30_091034 [Stylosanthes scabra]|uniref:Uncharacterized protein n=1 Tax=Stylosanthes scabra TaxID=79078 RepID=A0ABU6UUI8_9FABA|nr:hypothetical protein [Stylosanthes scabra]
MSTQAEILATPRSQQGVGIPTFSSPSQALFLVGLNSPGLQDLMDQIVVPNDGYRPEFDGSQLDVDLNEPDSGPSQSFMALAYRQGPSWEMPLPAPAHVPTPPTSPAPAEHHDQPPAQRRGRKIPCGRGCGTGGHIHI